MYWVFPIATHESLVTIDPWKLGHRKVPEHCSPEANKRFQCSTRHGAALDLHAQCVLQVFGIGSCGPLWSGKWHNLTWWARASTTASPCAMPSLIRWRETRKKLELLDRKCKNETCLRDAPPSAEFETSVHFRHRIRKAAAQCPIWTSNCPKILEEATEAAGPLVPCWCQIWAQFMAGHGTACGEIPGTKPARLTKAWWKLRHLRLQRECHLAFFKPSFPVYTFFRPSVLFSSVVFSKVLFLFCFVFRHVFLRLFFLLDLFMCLFSRPYVFCFKHSEMCVLRLCFCILLFFNLGFLMFLMPFLSVPKRCDCFLRPLNYF